MGKPKKKRSKADSVAESIDSFSDERLLRCILSRDEAPDVARRAFEELFSRYCRICLHHNYRMLHSGKRSAKRALAESEDIVQQKFMKLLKLENFDFREVPGRKSGAVVRVFLFRIDHNDCINFIKRSRRMVEFEDPDVERWECALFQAGYGETDVPDEAAVKKEQEEHLAEALETLSPAQKSAVVYWSRGYSYREIADFMGKTQTQIRGYITHGLKNLREQFDRYYER